MNPSADAPPLPPCSGGEVGGSCRDGLSTATSGRSLTPRKISVSGRSRQHAEVAVAVNSRRRHQGGEAVEQLQRRQQERGVSARTGLGALIEQAFGIELP
jgi:hypothetical protein